MKYPYGSLWGTIIVLILPALLFAQEFEFQQELDTIPLEIHGWMPHQPWAGGDEETCPTFCDIDADGDLDLFVGSFMGRISFFENVGTYQQAEYKLINRFYADVDLLVPAYDGRSNPAFCDLDGDGDFDLFSGDHEGLIHYWENIGTPTVPEFEHVTDSLDNILVYGNSQLAFCDIDADDDFDLFIGSTGGVLNFIRNDGNAQNRNFTFVSNFFDSINVGWFANPCLYDIDDDDDYDLFIGNDDGEITFYRNDGDPYQWNFVLVTEEFLGLDVGKLAAPEFTDIDGDDDLDFFCGREEVTGSVEQVSEIYYYENIGDSILWEYQYRTHSYTQLDRGRVGTINLIDIDADGDLDLFAPVYDNLLFIENIGDAANPYFLLHEGFYQDIYVPDIYPFFVDLDADGDYDLLASEGAIPSPSIWLFRNDGTPEQANFVLISEEFITGNFGVITAPSLGDIDADGDYDLFLSDVSANFYYYENIGNPQIPNFVWRENNWQGIGSYNMQRSSHFIDMDEDDDLDLIIDNNTGSGVAFYRNIGSPTNPLMDLVTEEFVTPDIPSQHFHHVSPYAVDIDADNDLDLFVGVQYDGILFFRNVTGQSEVGPKRPIGPPVGKLDLGLGPNPGNPVTCISFTLPSPQEATLAVYNILGAKVTTLASGLQSPGTQILYWNNSRVSSGVYIIRLETAGVQAVQRITVVK